MAADAVDEAKSIKVPGWAYDNARLAARELARRGTRSVAGKLGARNKCALCSGKLVELQCGDLRVLRCAACNYTRPDIESTTAITGGMVIGLALALLAESLLD